MFNAAPDLLQALPAADATPVAPVAPKARKASPKVAKELAALDATDAKVNDPETPDTSAVILSDIAEASKVAPLPPAEIAKTTGKKLAALWVRMNDRTNWEEVGTLLNRAKRDFGNDNNAFGAWIDEHAPGLKGNAATDAMWMVSDAFAAWLEETGAVVPAKKTHPTTVRRWFKAEIAKSQAADDAEGGEEAAGEPDDGRADHACKSPEQLIAALARKLVKGGFEVDAAVKALRKAMKAAATEE